MRRDELEHLIRASAHVADDENIVIVGSQAVLGEHPDAPASLVTSMDADVYPRAHPERADVIEGAIGEGSPFHATFGYYAHGVGPATAKAPAGWEERLVAVNGPGTAGATGWCLETNDLVLSKCVADRTKDWEFAREALRHGLVNVPELRRRAGRLPVDGRRRAALDRQLEAAAV